MGIPASAKTVIGRKLDKSRVKTRPGKGNMNFDYIPTDYAIELLNEAFDSEWSTRVVDSKQVDDNVIVLLELRVPNDNGDVIVKQQYGASRITSGLGPAEAYKGATSDALKKCATLLGIALELYQQDEEPVVPEFKTPQRATRPAGAPRASSMPTRAASVPRPAPAVPMPTPAAPAPSPAPGPSSVPVAQTQSPPARRPSPFERKQSPDGPSSTQLNALVNLAERKLPDYSKDQRERELIALANICDETGHPKTKFEDLTYNEAIQVIQASQR